VALIVVVVIVVTQVPHRLGHGGGEMVLILVPVDIHSGTDVEVVQPLFDLMLNTFEVVVVEELVEAVVDEDAGKGTTYGAQLSD
jgi:hypothetical protein